MARDILEFAYPKKIHAELRRAGFKDFGGVEEHDLPSHYEKVMGIKWEWPETNTPLPEYKGQGHLEKVLGLQARQVAVRESKERWGINGHGDGIVARENAANWRGYQRADAQSMGTKYLCPACGPVGEPLHGDDEAMHCPELDCDEIVDAVLPDGWELNDDWTEKQKARRNHVAEPKKCRNCGDLFDQPSGSGNYVHCSKCRKPSQNKGPRSIGPKAPRPTTKPKTLAPPKQQCSKCGCNDAAPCELDDGGVCEWAEQDLCDQCVPDTINLRQEAEALVRVAEALEGLTRDQIVRVLSWVESVL